MANEKIAEHKPLVSQFIEAVRVDVRLSLAIATKASNIISLREAREAR